MFSVVTGAASGIVSSIAPWIAAADAGNPPARVLVVIDLAILFFSIATVSALAAARLATGRRVPLDPLPHRFRDDTVVIIVLVYFLAMLVCSPFVRHLPGGPEGATATVVVGLVTHVAGITACLWAAARLVEGGVGRFLLGPAPTRRLGIGLTAVVAAVSAIGLCQIVLELTVHVVLLFDPDHISPSHPTLRLIDDPSQPFWIIAALWVGAALLAPIAEELFFRGILQNFVGAMLPRRWMTISAVSVAFGAIHFPQPETVPALILLGVLSGYAYERTGSILTPIAIHAVFNLKTLLWNAWGAFSA